MEFSEFAFRIILVFIPGLIAFTIVNQLTNQKKQEIYEKATYALILGLFSYTAYYFFIKIPWFKTDFIFLEVLSDENAKLDFKEILKVSFVSVLLGFFVSYAINYKWLHNFAYKFNISTKFGDLNVWSYTMTSGISPWVVVRDLKYDLMYQGWIQAYPDTLEEETGLYLNDVVVFKNSTGEELYRTDGLFISRNKEELIFDFQRLTLKLEQNVKENGGKTDVRT